MEQDMTRTQNESIAARFKSNTYQLLDKIGEGGFGCVYRAIQTSTGQMVAIKFLTVCETFDDVKRQRYHQRFERETFLCAKLRHPNIVLLLDKGISDGLPYAVFEYVEGQTLKQRLEANGALPGVEAAQVMAQILDALAHAHSLGILHRDIKPANIMLVDSGVKAHVKVLDFGIGTIVDETRQVGFKTITITDEVLGTPAYSAPEQLRGEPCTLKTDLYVWGLVFVECLTGRRAVTGASVASVMHQQLSDSVIPLPASILAHPVSSILRRVLDKKAFKRNAEPSQLYVDLGNINFSNLVISSHIVDASAVNDNHQLDMVTQTDVMAGSFTRMVERKQISALSLCLSMQKAGEQQSDVEVTDMILRDLQFQCIDTAVRFGGYHAGTLCDSMLFYFGFPIVNDSDARLCTRTALEVLSELSKRNGLLRVSHGVEISAQMGMHCGRVTCYGDEPPVGGMSNVAMQLARRAQSNQVLCSSDSYELIKSFMQCQPTALSANDFANNESTIYSIEAERRIEALSFFNDEKLQGGGFVGRKCQFERLHKGLNENDAGHISTLYVAGEAGVGKSRLVYQLRHKNPQLNQIVAQCLPEQQNNALFAILSLLKSYFCLESLSNEAIIERLKSMVACEHVGWSDKLADPLVRNKALSVLFMWLNVPVEQTDVLAQLSPEQQKRLLFELMAQLLIFGNEAKAESAAKLKQSALFIVEDLHWADPLTIEFVEHFNQCLRDLPHRLLLISRTLELPFAHQDNIEVLALGRLDSNESAQLVESLFGNKPVAKYLRELLIERTDGVPLYLEALVDVLKRKALVHERSGLIDFINIDMAEQLPWTLTDTMQQRLDGLPQGKETAQLASVIGREFDYDILVKASDAGVGQVQADLQALIAANIVYIQRKVDGDVYIFKHALLGEAAYQGLPVAKRQALHRRLADIMQNDFLARANQQPHILAHHFAIAQMPQQAASWFIRAGEMAQKIHAHLACVNYYQRVVELWLSSNEAENFLPSQQQSMAKVYRGIGEAEISLGRHEQGREALQRVLTFDSNEHGVNAQMHFQLGRSWAASLEHQRALLAYQAAEDCLAEPDNTESSADLWLKVKGAKVNVYYTLNDVESMTQLLEQYANEPVTSDDLLPRVFGLQNEFQLRLRQQRYTIDEKCVLLAKTALSMISDIRDEQVKFGVNFNYAMALYFNRQYDESYAHLITVSQSVQILDDVSMMTLCYTYLAINARHMQQTDLTEKYALQAQSHALNARMSSYEAAAKSNLAWVAMKKRDFEKVQSLLTAVDLLWPQNVSGNYPLQWLGKLVQMEFLLEKHQEVDTQTCEQLFVLAEFMLSESQQALPDDVCDALDNVLKAQQCPKTIVECTEAALDKARQHNMI